MKIVKYPSPNFNERPCAIDSIIIHYTDMTSAQEALKWLCNPTSQVSAHYLIEEEGQVFQLVNEDKRAWHAGESYWQGCYDLNSCSIGIELSNPGHSNEYTPFPKAQIDVLVRLCEGIRSRWDIPSSRILGHSDVAPRRKQDPGHLFPWKRFAEEGLGLWPAPFKGDFEIDITFSLNKIGYEIVCPKQALLAFQLHFQPHKVDGIPDQETYNLLQGLLKSQEMII